MSSYLIKINPADLLACPDCNVLLQKEHLEPGSKACCPRCGHVLSSPVKNSVEKALVCALTGLLLFIPAVFLPIMTLDTMGLEQAGSIFDSIIVVHHSGYRLVAIMAAFTAVIFPLIKLLLTFTIAFFLKIKRYPEFLPNLMRYYKHLKEWGMLEVFMLGILVAIIKLHHMAHIHYNFGFACFIGLLVMALYASVTMDEHEYWKLIGEKSGCRQFACQPQREKDILIPKNCHTAAAAGLILCPDCHKLLPADSGLRHCTRCDATLHQLKPDSLNRTWALVLTAAILFFPANILPIMKVDFLGQADYSTIMDGIIYFFQTGSYGIGAIILTASILVPCFKIIGIILILLSIHFHWQSWLRHKTLLFRIIEFVGRWSMLDIFVIALLQALFNFGNLTSIEAAPAATYFTGVVIATMFSAITFDLRLLWAEDYEL